MKKLSIKFKLTLWFTIFMILLCVIAFFFIAIVSQSTATSDVRNALIELVDGNIDEIEYDDGELDIDDDFVSFKNGVYCIIYYEDGTRISGYSPYEGLEYEPFEDKSIRTVSIDGESYLIYDRLINFIQIDDVWIRGIVSGSSSAISSTAMSQAALIALPMLIVLASVGGYIIAKRSLKPIEQISETAEAIGNGSDLSRRIEIEGDGDELHKLAGTFNRMFDRLETNFEAERHFTSDASHELRTPVSIILANCEYAFENASNEEELYETIGAIQKQGYRMSHLIESLLGFTRLEQKTENLNFDLIDLSKEVLSISEEQKQFSVKGISLTERIQPGIMMEADIGLFSQMLINLIQNAYKYGREKGSICIKLEENDDIITLSVEDDGIGISESELTKIWNRFYRVDKSRSNSRGLGLGLSMVKQIAQLHNGDVDVKSQLGKGSVFIITFKK